jgi:hypothetical protein
MGLSVKETLLSTSVIRSLRFATLLWLCCTLYLSSGAAAQGIMGRWRGSLLQPGGTRSLTLELQLRETGDTIEGSLNLPELGVLGWALRGYAEGKQFHLEVASDYGPLVFTAGLTRGRLEGVARFADHDNRFTGGLGWQGSTREWS